MVTGLLRHGIPSPPLSSWRDELDWIGLKLLRVLGGLVRLSKGVLFGLDLFSDMLRPRATAGVGGMPDVQVQALRPQPSALS